MQMAKVHEAAAPATMAKACFTLCKLVLMMREGEVNATRMQIKLLAKYFTETHI